MECPCFGQFVSNELGTVWVSDIARFEIGKEAELLRKPRKVVRLEAGAE